MSWRIRSVLIAGGLMVGAVSVAHMRAGIYLFDNATYHQQTYAWSGLGLGVLLCLLAFLPPSDWVFRHITTKKSRTTKSPSKRTHIR